MTEASHIQARAPRGRTRPGKVFSIVLLTGIAVLILLPIVFTFLYSFFPESEIEAYLKLRGSYDDTQWLGVLLSPKLATIRQYYTILIEDPQYLKLFVNSVKYSAGILLGQALVVPSPVHVRAAYVGSDWQLSWVRRSRSGWRWNDGADAPVAEEQELYRVNLIHNGAIFRTAETGVAQWIYGAADIAADQSAGVSGSVTVEIRQIGTYGLGRPASIDIII